MRPFGFPILIIVVLLSNLQPVFTFEEASMPEYVLKEVLKQGFTQRKFCPTKADSILIRP